MQGIVFNDYYTWMDIGHTEPTREVVGPVQQVFYPGVDVMVAESSARTAPPPATTRRSTSRSGWRA